MEEIGLYIHIPFCSSRCYYCDFLSFANKKGYINDYIHYLLKEISLYKDKLREYSIKTIFIGGGTPSFLQGQHLANILEKIYKNFKIDRLEEVTIETNPESLTKDKLKLYREYGINRISMGVQSLNDKLLKSIGRVHNSNDVYKGLELIRSQGFENVNMDLIFGLPGQSLDECINTLNKVIGLGVEHISYYELSLEDNTTMKRWHNDGKLDLPSEDLVLEMYHRGIELLKTNGYRWYEISNFAKQGLECRHNLFYWQLKPYIGLGLGSHSNIEGERYWNYGNFKDYFTYLKENKLPIEGKDLIDKRMEMAEYLIMGLRLIKGINKLDFYKRFNKNVEDVYGDLFNKNQEKGLIYKDDEWIRFTPRGLDISNLVYIDILP